MTASATDELKIIKVNVSSFCVSGACCFWISNEVWGYPGYSEKSWMLVLMALNYPGENDQEIHNH